MQSDQSYPMEVSTAGRGLAPSIVPLAGIANNGQPDRGYITNLNGKGVELAAMVTTALSAPSLDLDGLAGKQFPVQYYLAHVADFVSDTGEVIPLPRVVLIAPNGSTLAFTSEGAIKSFDLIRQLCGDGPWTPPLFVSAVPIKTRRGFRTFRLVVSGESNGSLQEKDNDTVRRSFRSGSRSKVGHDVQSPADSGAGE